MLGGTINALNKLSVLFLTNKSKTLSNAITIIPIL